MRPRVRSRAARVASLALVVLLGACSGPGQEGSGPPGPSATEDVGTVTVERRDIESVVTLEGVAAPVEGQLVGAPAAGTVTERSEVGQPVDEGSTIAMIRTSDRDVPVQAPTDGVVEQVDVGAGEMVRSGDPLMRVRPDRFVARAPIEPAQLYRFYDEPLAIVGNIDRGPSGFPCALEGLGADPEALRRGNPLQAEVALTCRLPEDLQVFAGVRLLLAVTTARARDVPALPVTAVDGASDRGVVSLVGPGGTVESQPVELGVTDGVNVEIVDGLDVGDEVRSVPRGVVADLDGHRGRDEAGS